MPINAPVISPRSGNFFKANKQPKNILIIFKTWLTGVIAASEILNSFIKRAKININTSENETAIIAPFKTFNNKFDLTPTGIINYLDLRKPIYRLTTNYGHFGKDNLSWEKIIEL